MTRLQPDQHGVLVYSSVTAQNELRAPTITEMSLPNGGIGMRGISNTGYQSDSDSQKHSDGPDDFDEQSFSDSVNCNDRLPTTALNEPRKQWDVFEKTEQEPRYVQNLEFWHTVYIAVRAILCVVFFILVLGTSTLNKLVVLVIAYNINSSGRVVNVGNATLTNGTQESINLKNGTGGLSVRWVWAMILVMAAPYLFTFIRSTVRVLSTRQRRLQYIPLMVVFIAETLHSVGLNLFLLVVAPYFDSLMTLMLMQAIGIVPSVLRLFWRKRKTDETDLDSLKITFLWRLMAIIACVLNVLFLGAICWRVYTMNGGDVIITVMIPISVILISFSWWDNFVQKENNIIKDKAKRRSKSDRFYLPRSLSDLVKSIEKHRPKIDFFVSLWKMCLSIVIPVIMFGSNGGDCIRTFFLISDKGSNCSLWGNVDLIDGLSPTDICWRYLPFVFSCSSIFFSGLGYKMAKSACKIRAQEGCFSLPLFLSTPLTFIVASASYTGVSLSKTMGCDVSWLQIPGHLGLKEFLLLYTRSYWLPLLMVGIFSFALITVHVWTPKAERVAATEKLFTRPLYCGVFFDQSLMMNRRTDDSYTTRGQKKKKKIEEKNQRLTSSFTDENYLLPNAKTPKIFVCATMWHENETEMVQVLKSIFRLDIDQNTRLISKNIFKVPDKDFYEFEAHIFFDDAFEEHKKDKCNFTVNRHVKQFMVALKTAAAAINPSQITPNDPTRVPTPYGGRLEWRLPVGNNILCVHLKNQHMVRIKKRWSQVMYMYYFLSYKLFGHVDMSQDNLERASSNTFVLALDGDVDFQPTAVQLLLDRMRKNPDVGAACGRIHPIGNGPMIWYQKFEYAISHWLQKATEHILGCVLCSPGCFSMFRGSALMDDNVVRRYTDTSTKARHFVQFDQGEDRWLCTLLLQQGHRVEYCAAADAKTYAPEGFREFYSQRRRWTTSTMANLLDLLGSWAHVRRKNNNISFLFIFYQVFLFVSSVLTPGTIFMLIFGAINVAYPDMPLYGSMLSNLFPVVIFIVLCFVSEQKVQLAYVEILSVAYTMVMTIVIVGLLKQIVQTGFCSITAMFFLFVVTVFLVTAVFHPQESVNVLHGFLYFLATPSMSMLLIFYSLINLHVISWGTRETTQTPKEMEEPQDPEESSSSTKKNLHQWLQKLEGKDDADSSYVLSFGEMFRCICCPKPHLRDQEMKYKVILEKLEDLEYAFRHKDDRDDHDNDDFRANEDAQRDKTNVKFSEESGLLETGLRKNPVFQDDPSVVRNNLHNTNWLKDNDLGKGPRRDLDPQELKFWTELIETYLKPITPTAAEKKATENDLKGLRNKVCMFFFLSNSVFVTLIFMLESVSEYTSALIIRLPCSRETQGAKIEPIGIAFTFIFGILLFVQFIAMALHRFSTLLHIASISQIRLTHKNKQETKREAYHQLINDMQRSHDYDAQSLGRSSLCGSEDGLGEGDTFKGRSKKKLMRGLMSRRDGRTLPDQEPTERFITNFKKLSRNINDNDFESKVPKIFPGYSKMSLFTIVQMAKDEKEKKVIFSAQQNWEKLREKIQQKPSSAMAGLVDTLLTKQKEDKAKVNEFSANKGFQKVTVHKADTTLHPETENPKTRWRKIKTVTNLEQSSQHRKLSWSNKFDIIEGENDINNSFSRDRLSQQHLDMDSNKNSESEEEGDDAFTNENNTNFVFEDVERTEL